MLNSILEFAAVVYFASELGPATVGTFFLFQAVLRVASLFADLGVDDGIEKRISEGNDISRYLSAGLLIKTVSICVICSIVLLAGESIDLYFGSDLAVFLVVGILLYQTYSTAIKVLNGEQRVGETAVLRLIQKSIWFFGGYLLIIEGFGLIGLVYSLLAGYMVSSAVGWGKTSTGVSKPSFSHLMSIIDYSKFQIISRIGGKLYSWLDLLVIGYFLTQTAVGQYEVAWRIASVAVLFSTSLSTSVLPKVSHWYANGDIDRIERALPAVITFSMVPVIPAFFGVLLYSREILHYLFGAEYSAVWLVLIILMSYKPIQAVQSVIGPALLGIDKPGLAARATVVSVTINVLLNVVLVWQFGLVGAAIATIVASLVSDGLMYRYLSRYVSVRFETQKIGWALLSSAVMAIVLLGVQRVLTVQNVFSLILAVCTGAAIYTVMMFVYTPFRQQFTDVYLDAG